MIVGLTGTFCGGKDTVAEYLKKKGFVHYSLSDILREELRRRKVELTRTNLQKLGNALRQKYGYGILAEKVLKKIEEGKNYVVTSIRHPDELNALMKSKELFLVKVDAPVNLRFERMKKRNRENDPKTFEEFKKIEQQEMHGNENEQRIAECVKKAKIILINNSSFDVLYKKIDKLVDDLSKKIPEEKRLDWDNYFLKLALVIAERSTCLRHHIGAIAVKNKRVLATGYNGAISGLTDCTKLGCLRNKLKIPSGEKQEICRSVHAEQNLLVQAALHGISLEGATVYCTHTPCIICAKLLANTKIKRFVTFSEYNDKNAIVLLRKVGIKLDRYKTPDRKISMKL